MTIPKVLIIRVFLVLLVFGAFTQASSQCVLKHELKVSQPSDANPNGQIHIVSGESQANVLFKLFKESDGKIEEVSSNRHSLRRKESKLIFDSVEPSTYFILAEWTNCKTGIGGITGIVINKSR